MTGCPARKLEPDGVRGGPGPAAGRGRAGRALGGPVLPGRPADPPGSRRHPSGRVWCRRAQPVQDAAADPLPGGEPAPGSAPGFGTLLRSGRDRGLSADDRRPERHPAEPAASRQGGRPEPAVDAAGGAGDWPGRRSDQLLGPRHECPPGHLLRGRPAGPGPQPRWAAAHAADDRARCWASTTST